MKELSGSLAERTNEGDKRFKFQSFNTRVDRIKVDVVRRSRRVEEDPELRDSFFYESLEEWKELNQTKHFTVFFKEILPLVKSFPLIIHHKEKIVDILEKHIKVPDSMALDALLDLVTKLAKDLEGEFYPYFPRILNTILTLVHKRDVQLLENLFNCIAYLFKFLARQILPDLCSTYSLLEHLLGKDTRTKPYIQHFTAEAFAFLLRKARGDALAKIIHHILASLRSNPTEEFAEGIAMLFFEYMKQVNNQLHSKAPSLFKELLLQITNTDLTDEHKDGKPLQNILGKTLLLALHHTHSPHATPLVDILLQELDAQVSAPALDENKTLVLMFLLSLFVTVRKGSRIEDYTPIVQSMQKASKFIFSTTAFSDALHIETLRVVTGILTLGPLEALLGGGRLMLESVTLLNKPSLVYPFFIAMASLEWSGFTQNVLQYIIRYSADKYEAYPQATILFLGRLFADDALKIAPGTLSSSLTSEGLLRFPGDALPKSLLTMISTPCDWAAQRDLFNETDPEATGQVGLVSTYTAALKILSHVHIKPVEAVNALLALIQSITSFLESEEKEDTIINAALVVGHKNFVLETLAGTAVESFAHYTALETNQSTLLPDKIVQQLLFQHGSNGAVLRGIYKYLDALRVSIKYRNQFSLDRLQPVYDALKTNLNSYQSLARLYTLKILGLYDQPLMEKDQDHVEDEKCRVVQIAIELEESEVTIVDYRDKVRGIQDLAVIASGDRVPEIYHDFILRYSFGIYTMNIQPMWAEARQALKAFADNNREEYWNFCFEELCKYRDERMLMRDSFSKDAILESESGPEINSARVTKTGNISFACPNYSRYVSEEDYALELFNEKQAAAFALLTVQLSGYKDERMDFWNYYNQLLKTLKETSRITEKHARQIIPIFFDFFRNEYAAAEDADDYLDLILPEADDTSMTERKSDLGLLDHSAKTVKTRMFSWLELFAAFSNTKGVFKSADLHRVFMGLLAKGDPKLQSAVLDCLFTWKEPSVRPYNDNLKNLLDEVKFRDELQTLLLNEDQTSIDPAHRAGLMPVLLRVLFGRLIQPHGKYSGKINKSTRQKAILGAVGCCKNDEIQYFLDLALQTFKYVLAAHGKQQGEFAFVESGVSAVQDVPVNRQLAFMTFYEDMLKSLSSQIITFLPPLLTVVLYIGRAAQVASSNNMDVDEPTHAHARAKDLRSLAMRRIMETFELSGGFNFTPYLPAIFVGLITPRVPGLAKEAAQSMSAQLSLFELWAGKREYVTYLIDYNDELLPQLIRLGAAKKLDERVLSTLLSIFESILNHCDNEMEVDGVSLRDRLVKPYVDLLLETLRYRLTESRDDTKFGTGRYAVRQIGIVWRIAPYTKDGKQAAAIVNLLLPNLVKATRTIPEPVKENILLVWARFFPILPDLRPGTSVYYEQYAVAAQMFSLLKQFNTRKALLEVFSAFVQIDPSLERVGSLLQEMNKRSADRIDDHDYDALVSAVNEVSDGLYKELTHHQWQPLLHQFFHCMHNTEEAAVRGSAMYGLTCYFKAAAEVAQGDEKIKMENDISGFMFQTIKEGLLDSAETVRFEYVNLLDTAVTTFPELPAFEDLQHVANKNEDLNFFKQVYHVQLHRRQRAVERLGREDIASKLKPMTITSIFLPLINGFFYDDRVLDHAFINTCVATVQVMAKYLTWNFYYRVYNQYLSMLKKKETKVKAYVRLVNGILEAFHFDVKNVVSENEQVAVVKKHDASQIELQSTEALTEELNAPKAEKQPKAEDTRSEAERIHHAVLHRIIPDLSNFMNNTPEKKDAIMRIPLAMGMVQILRHLPEKSMRINLPSLLINLCQNIRSRAEDVRNATREILTRINRLLGPTYLVFTIRELKTALTKGYEKHVRNYTVNALLDDAIPRLQVGELDYCLQDIVEVLIDDIFGVSGEEKDSEDLKGKIREAKTHKSGMTFQALAGIIRFENVNTLLMPLKDVMSVTHSTKILAKVDDVLKRISTGLVQNPAFDSTELLDFARDLIGENLDAFKTSKRAKKKKTVEELNFEVNLKRQSAYVGDAYRDNSYRFVGFGLSLLQAALRRGKFDPASEEYKPKLDAFIGLVENVLYSKQTNNVVLALRVICLMIIHPLPSKDAAVPRLVKRVFQLIKGSGNNIHSKLVQHSFKLLTLCLEDSKTATLNEHQLTYLLTIIRPDLEEPEHQGTVFALVRAILSRKFMAPEVYDLMGVVSQIMVTNQTLEVRRQARKIYFMFLMDYPHGKSRIQTQMAFIIKNMEYPHESGRESVMELLHHIVTKFGEDTLMEFAEPMLFAIVLRLVNDESSKCREMSAELLKALLKRCDETRLATVFKLLNTWIADTEKSNLQRTACQVYGLVIEALPASVVAPVVTNLVVKLGDVLELSKEQQEAILDQYENAETDDDMDVDLPWEVSYYGLNTFSKLAKVFPDVLQKDDSLRIYQGAEDLLLHPHAWVRSASARVFGTYFATVKPETRNEYLTRDRLRNLASKFEQQLESVHLTQEQADQLVRNLYFIGRCFYYLPPAEDPQPEEEKKIAEAPARPSLAWLFWLVSFNAGRTKPKRTLPHLTAAFKWFAAMSNLTTEEELEPFLMPAIKPILRFEDDKARTGDGIEDVRALGTEVLNMLQKKAGSSAYFAAYQSIRSKRKDEVRGDTELEERQKRAAKRRKHSQRS